MEAFGQFFGLLVLIGILLLILLGILLPVSAYSAQKWAKKCHDELVKLNRALAAGSARAEHKEPLCKMCGGSDEELKEKGIRNCPECNRRVY